MMILKILLCTALSALFGLYLATIVYCCCMVIKYQRLATIERKYIYEKYGIWIDEEPIM